MVRRSVGDYYNEEWSEEGEVEDEEISVFARYLWLVSRNVTEPGPGPSIKYWSADLQLFVLFAVIEMARGWVAVSRDLLKGREEMIILELLSE